MKTYKGNWFLPGHDNDYRHGVLTISDDGEASLEVFGLFTSYHYEQVRKSIADDSTTLIWGKANGKPITLSKCIPSLISHGRDNMQIFSIGCVFLGGHFQEESLLFKRMRFRSTNLNEWIAPRNMQLNVNREDKKIDLTYTLPEKVYTSISDGLQLILMANSNKLIKKHPFYEFYIREDHYFEFKSKEALSFDRLMHLQFILLSFLEIAIGSNQLPLDITAFDEEQEIQVICHLIEKKTKDHVNPEFMLLSYPQVKDLWGKIIATWFKTYEKMDDIYNLYFSICRGSIAFTEQKFLGLAQFLESYHRRWHPVTKEEKAAWKVNKKRILASVESQDKDCVEKALQYGYEPSFKKRLEFLFDQCRLTEHILKGHKQKDFISAIVATRNYFTHYTKSKMTIYDPKRLLDISKIMDRFAQYYLLISAGFSHDQAEGLFRQKYSYYEQNAPEVSMESSKQEDTPCADATIST